MVIAMEAVIVKVLRQVGCDVNVTTSTDLVLAIGQRFYKPRVFHRLEASIEMLLSLNGGSLKRGSLKRDSLSRGFECSLEAMLVSILCRVPTEA